MNEDSPLLTDIRNLYAETAAPKGVGRCIDPFIGEAFINPARGALRIMGIGINAYCDGSELSSLKPGVYSTWYRDQRTQGPNGRRLRFFTAAKNQMNVVARTAAADGNAFHGIAHDATVDNCAGNHYFTNVVKRYVDQSVGKAASDLDPQLVDNHIRVLPRELEILAKHNRFPHIIVLFWSTPDPPWRQLWKPLHDQSVAKSGHCASRISVLKGSFKPAEGNAGYHANRIEINEGESTRPLLLLRLAHPTRAGRAKWNPSALSTEPALVRILRKDMGVAL